MCKIHGNDTYSSKIQAGADCCKMTGIPALQGFDYSYILTYQGFIIELRILKASKKLSEIIIQALYYSVQI